jgi:hypothetical protein
MPILRNEVLAVGVKCLRHKEVMIARAGAPHFEQGCACACFYHFKNINYKACAIAN